MLGHYSGNKKCKITKVTRVLKSFYGITFQEDLNGYSYHLGVVGDSTSKENF